MLALLSLSARTGGAERESDRERGGGRLEPCGFRFGFLNRSLLQ